MASLIELTGIDEFTAALNATMAAVDRATADATAMASDLVEGRARANLARTSHSRRTPTPSAPGSPPAKIDGTLQNSWQHSLPLPDGVGGWVCTLTSDLPYSSIQEVGGWAGRGHRSHLPPRPYLRPAVDDAAASGEIRDAYMRAWAAAIEA